ncbi:MAG: hypothetical protein J6U98_06205, partial [Abditibacteriota bacterium]|nr:hypothetical protein [Abditibacteriota bacterium]
EDRLQGVGLYLGKIDFGNLAAGTRRNISGTVRVDGEGKYIEVDETAERDGSVQLRPLALPKTLLTGNNLVRVWGKVISSSAASNSFVIKNGYGEITVRGRTAQVDDFVVVTGIATPNGVRYLER